MTHDRYERRDVALFGPISTYSTQIVFFCNKIIVHFIYLFLFVAKGYSMISQGQQIFGLPKICGLFIISRNNKYEI